jgi:hypothetical protein
MQISPTCLAMRGRRLRISAVRGIRQCEINSTLVHRPCNAVHCYPRKLSETEPGITRTALRVTQPQRRSTAIVFGPLKELAALTGIEGRCGQCWQVLGRLSLVLSVLAVSPMLRTKAIGRPVVLARCLLHEDLKCAQRLRWTTSMTLRTRIGRIVTR